MAIDWENLTKQDVYVTVVEATQLTGQGMTGLIRDQNPKYGEYLDELIEEGMLMEYDTDNQFLRGSSRYFYMPTSGYNVWLDERTTEKFRLTFVRYYLGREDNQNKNLSENVEGFRLYNEWLDRNSDELEIMMSLDKKH